MVKIAFGYKCRIGKDTACKYLIRKYGGKKFSFAEPLYDILTYAQTICKFDKTKDRKFLQFVGTDWARSINDYIWINLLIEKISKEDDSDNIFISDLRFKNEFLALKEQGFVCVLINGKNNNNQNNTHQSNIDLQDWNRWDYTINNDTTIENFYSQLDLLFKKSQKRKPFIAQK
jgi:hypothetical protein